MKTLDKLKAKAFSPSCDNVRMPSISSISEMLTEMGIKHSLYDSTNVVEYRSKGMRYVNSRHNGKEGKRLIIEIDEKDKDMVGTYRIELDSSYSYYSHNTWSYANKILKLLESKGKI